MALTRQQIDPPLRPRTTGTKLKYFAFSTLFQKCTEGGNVQSNVYLDPSPKNMDGWSAEMHRIECTK